METLSFYHLTIEADKIASNEDKHYCFVVPYGGIEKVTHQMMLNKYNIEIKIHRNKPYVKEFRATLDRKFPSFESLALTYLSIGEKKLDLLKFKELALCPGDDLPWRGSANE